ncbi:MAG: UDP-N-acetylmuramate:L-alanyl-gamma-D-glutamyl-meso-diaminopimelate ligase [Chromatiales bacterium]|nr:UDP-N-acetylmuramate:L-alanyl-gamma-D-glutamyl-meso-diaminopimelate ligase [Chromatiales bacterium]
MPVGKIYLLGISGTFMAGLACIARELGWSVYGCDKAAWPPMSKQLIDHHIKLDKPCSVSALGCYDSYIIGNAMSRGNELVEALLTQRIPIYSAPQWLYEQVLHNRRVLCVAGSHGKTTTTAMLAWILEFAGMQPGFLIGGVPINFGISARLGHSDLFVIEGDEYDTAFFDKRSKFVHYHPQVLVLNNLEFDHADIFDDLAAVQTQFHHLLRTLATDDYVLIRAGEPALDDVIKKGFWSQCEYFDVDNDTADWQAHTHNGGFDISYKGKAKGHCQWGVAGEHNIANAVGAVAAAARVGVPPQTALQALADFKGVRRRLEVCSTYQGITVYDDFAHHPSEIKASIAALCSQKATRVLVAFEPRSNTMKAGIHNDILGSAFDQADCLFFYSPADLDWSAEAVLQKAKLRWSCYADIDRLRSAIIAELAEGDHLLIMSNGDFAGLKDKLLADLKEALSKKQ